MTGGVHAITGSATLDARFPGQWFQLESGLHYNWHRQYDPTIGRYIQADPLGFVDGPSVYGYARGGPQALVDPTGELAWFLPPIIGFGAGLAYDYIVETLKERCGCNPGTTAGTIGNAGIGAGIAATGPYLDKPRGGLAGGGPSGKSTSSWSTAFGRGLPRRLGRGLSFAVPGVGAVIAASDAHDIYQCLKSRK